MYEMPLADSLVVFLLAAPVVLASLWFAFRLMAWAFELAFKRRE